MLVTDRAAHAPRQAPVRLIFDVRRPKYDHARFPYGPERLRQELAAIPSRPCGRVPCGRLDSVVDIRTSFAEKGPAITFISRILVFRYACDCWSHRIDSGCSL